MGRLTLEELSRLVDEQPTASEQAALDADPEARRDAEALRALKRRLRGLRGVRPPRGAWEDLRKELIMSGLIRAPLTGASLWRMRMRAAAAVVVFIGGSAFGWVAARSPATESEQLGGGDARAASQVENAAAPVSLDEARTAVEQAELAWRRAYRRHQEIFHAQHGRQPRRDPVARLAGIEALVAAGEAAVQESPDDEFINFLYVNTLEERQQTLQQISLGAWH